MSLVCVSQTPACLVTRGRVADTHGGRFERTQGDAGHHHHHPPPTTTCWPSFVQVLRTTQRGMKNDAQRPPCVRTGHFVRLIASLRSGRRFRSAISRLDTKSDHQFNMNQQDTIGKRSVCVWCLSVYCVVYAHKYTVLDTTGPVEGRHVSE